MHVTRSFRIASFICALAAACGGSDSKSNDSASGKDGGGDHDAARPDDGSGGSKHKDDAGSTEAKDDAGNTSGGSDASTAMNDAGGNGSSGSGGSGGAMTDDCTPKEDAVPTWTELDPKLPDYEVRDIGIAGAPPPAGFGGVAYGNGMFVAVGLSADEDHMRWATSTDGMKWTGHEQPIETGKTYSTSRIHFLNGKFIFFQEHSGDGAHVYSSSDGMKWTSSKIFDTRLVVDEFAADGDQVVVAGESGTSIRSSDLETWDPVAVGGGGASFNDIDFGGGRWIATINAGGQVFGSADAKTWTMIDGLGAPGGFRVEFGNDAWLLYGQAMHFSSTDGKKFDAVTPVHNGAGARFAGGRFIDNGFDLNNNLVFSTSDDGKTWTDYGMLPPETLGSDEKTRTRLIKDIAYGNCRYVIAGQLMVQTNPTNASDFLSAKQHVLPLLLVGVLESK